MFIPNLYLAGISTDPKTFWAYAVGFSPSSAAVNAVHDYPNAFLTALHGYNSMDIAKVASYYGCAIESSCWRGCIYVPYQQIIGGVKHYAPCDVKRLIEG